MKNVIILAMSAAIAVLIVLSTATKNAIAVNEVLAGVLYDEDVQSQKNRISLLRGDQLLMSASGGMKLPGNVVFSDEQGAKTSLKEVVGGRRKFVFRYSHLNCNVCIDAAVLLVKALTEEIGAENVVYIATYSNGRDLTVFRRVNQLRAKVYNVESLPIAPDRANVPYCFVIEPDNQHRQSPVYSAQRDAPARRRLF